ncbi:MAG: hypothetical protein PHT44_03935 [Candidatus Portnoybacteria bacterium]|nr:hypothetical protein [Candidatus Portnoybacteria bacterium]MDD4983024.1 hypothetical protein [Candidatus Portnoybacteria bacterium]
MTNRYKNIILVISGTMASGKDAVLRLLRKNVDFSFVKSFTSRPRRHNEKTSPPYKFISRKKFKKLVSKNFFWEFKKLYGHFYGIAKIDIRRALARQKPVVFRVNEQGADKIKSFFPETKSVFIAPPSLEVVKERAARRKSVPRRLKNKRLAAAKKQLNSLTKDQKWDYVIVNKDLRQSVEKIGRVIGSLKTQ